MAFFVLFLYSSLKCYKVHGDFIAVLNMNMVHLRGQCACNTPFPCYAPQGFLVNVQFFNTDLQLNSFLYVYNNLLELN